MLIRLMLIMIALAPTVAARAQEDIFADKENAVEQPDDAELTEKSLIESALMTGELMTFVAIIKAARLSDELDSRRPLTVFAPADEAFSRLPDGTITRLLKLENRDQLVALIQNHVVRSTFPTDKLQKTKTLKTMHGASFTTDYSDDDLRINSARILTPDIPIRTGVLHIVDTVMMPKE